MSETITGIHVYTQTAYGGPKQQVEVNSNSPIKLTTDDFDVYVLVRIRDYANDKIHHIDHAEALKYFEDEAHKNDTISVQFIVYFKKDVSGDKLLWGNDWDKPIRDILPWGFSAAFSFFKYAVDPGVDGDVYADKPWVYGPAITSINHLLELGPETEPMSVKGPIKDPDASTRCKKYLDENERKNYTYEKGHFYAFDFSNPYLDMSTTPKIKMPGFTFDVGKYAGLTDLRYVLKCGDKLVFALSFSATKDGDATPAEESHGSTEDDKASKGTGSAEA